MSRRVTVLLCALPLGLAACSDYSLEEQKGDDLPDAELLVEPAELDFGYLELGEEATEVVTVSSIGTAALALEGLLQTGSGAFTVAWADGEDILAPGDSRDLIVGYTPQNMTDEGQLTVVADVGEGPVSLLGGGLIPALSIDPSQVELLSTDGAPVEGQAWLESAGTATLELGTHVLDGSGVFEIELDTPVDLEPGEGIWLDVVFTPPSEGTWTGKVWLETNTPAGQAAVPLLGEYPPPCLGLAEAWDRGFLDLSMGNTGNIIVDNESEDYDLCIDNWYVYISSETQDAGAGDPYFDAGAEYPQGTITVEPGDSHQFSYGITHDDAWWCIEQEQVTAPTVTYEFTGARVPGVLLNLMLQGDQDAIWAWIADNPAILVGRTTNYLHFADTRAGTVELETRNLGRVAGTGTIEETVPAGYVASGFSPEPDSSADDGEGGTTYRWTLAYDGAIDTAIDTHTIYDIQNISYTLAVADTELQGRDLLPEPTSSWRDSNGTTQTSSGSPMVVEIE